MTIQSRRPASSFFFGWKDRIHLRLLIPFVVVLLLTAAAAWWSATRMFSRTLEMRIHEHLSHAATVLAEGQFPLTEELVTKAHSLLRAEIILIRRDGGIGISTMSNLDHLLHEAIRKEFRSQSAKAEDFADGSPQSLLFNGIYMAVIRLIPESRDQRYSAVVLLGSFADVRLATREAAIWIGIATLLGVSFVTWAGQRIARGIIDPVRDLARMAERITLGDRQVRVKAQRSDEIGELASILNAMAEKLETFEEMLTCRSRLEALGEMSARIAHEIRNPLTAIKIRLQLMLESTEAAQAESLGQVLDEIRRLELVVSNTLDLGRSWSIEPVPTDLNDLVNEMVHLFAPQMRHRAIMLEIRLDSSLPRIWLDSDRIKQVLLNLLVNAADVLARGGRIRIITGRAVDGRPMLAVDDSGPGVEPGQLMSLFTPLHTKKAGGFGLGLPICKEIMELHGGTIEVSSGDLGGARFTVYFSLEPSV